MNLLNCYENVSARNKGTEVPVSPPAMFLPKRYIVTGKKIVKTEGIYSFWRDNPPENFLTLANPVTVSSDVG
jgi:hypothetical protein